MTQLQALGLTLLFEVPLVVLVVLLARWPAERGRLVLVSLACSLLTHPFAWHGIRAARALIPEFWPRALVGEVLVALVEGLLYAKLARLGWGRGMLLGFLANAWSFGLGLWISRYLLSG